MDLLLVNSRSVEARSGIWSKSKGLRIRGADRVKALKVGSFCKKKKKGGVGTDCFARARTGNGKHTGLLQHDHSILSVPSQTS